ncbi:MAG: hypothetical protein ACE5MM_07120, partial [Nitrospiraceae bacterium]
STVKRDWRFAKAWLMEEAERRRVLAIWEDLHWADPTTLELLGLVIDQTPTAQMLTMLTYRPEFVPPWPSRSHMTPITLNRIDRQQVEALIAQLAGGKPLPDEVVEHIVTKTDGVPLFVEELTKMILESNVLREAADHYALTGPLSSLTIPVTLQDSLMARLDRLPAGREVAQLGSVVGREFPYELLQAVATLDAAPLQSGLAELVDAELLYQRGRPPRSTYIFKHVLIRDAAYASLLKRTRQQVHQQIARVLEAQFPETTKTQPELLAHHCTEAGLNAQAIGYWHKAGQRAQERAAYQEATHHLTRGLQMLTTLPDASERLRWELDLLVLLGPTLMILKGFGAAEVEETYTRVRALCEQLDDPQRLLHVLYGLRRVYTHRGDLQKVYELSEQYLHLAQRLQDVHMQLDAHYSLGLSRLQRGELPAGQVAFEQGIALDADPLHRMTASRATATDPGMMNRIFVSWALWARGYPDRALSQAHEALTLAQELSQPFMMSHTLVWIAWLHQYCRKTRETREQAEATMALASQHGYKPQWGWGMALCGWAAAEPAEGLTKMRQGLDAVLTSGSNIWRPHLLALHGEVHAAAGRPDAGLRLLDEALELVEKTGERFHEAELYRLKGELLLRQMAPDEHQAETCFQRALDIARRQQAKSWELRATVSLSRLWQKQRKRDKARQMLAEIYGWFTEGCDTGDLKETKALLEELS